jgi:hypothetical protein
VVERSDRLACIAHSAAEPHQIVLVLDFWGWGVFEKQFGSEKPDIEPVAFHRFKIEDEDEYARKARLHLVTRPILFVFRVAIANATGFLALILDQKSHKKSFDIA